MKTTVICDFFGVIYPDSYEAWLGEKGLVREGELDRAAQMADLDLIDIEEFFDAVAQADDSDAETVEMEFGRYEFPDRKVVDLLERLHKRYTMVLVSNSNSGYLRRQLQKYDLERLFDHLIISGEAGVKKPDVKIFQKALNLAKAEASQAVFIDDRLENVNAAADVGIESVHYSNPAELEDELRDLGLDIPRETG